MANLLTPKGNVAEGAKKALVKETIALIGDVAKDAGFKLTDKENGFFMEFTQGEETVFIKLPIQVGVKNPNETVTPARTAKASADYSNIKLG